MDSQNDPQPSMIHAKAYLAKGDFETAEQHFIDAHENAVDAKTRDSASTAMIDLILLPQERYSETRMWIRSVVSGELRADCNSTLKSLSRMPSLRRAPENLDWKLANFDNPWIASKNQQANYERLLKKLSQDNQVAEQRDIYSTWPGPGFTGFVKGIWNSATDSFLSIGLKRETVAAQRLN